MKKERRKEQTTYLLKKEESDPTWFVFDAAGKTLGRFASEITKVLRGKHKPTFTSHIDGGDGVIIINAEKVHVTGNKEAMKKYFSYSGYVGSVKEVPYRVMQAKKPEYILEHAIKKMMPRTRLANAQLKRLRIFKGQEHGMDAQKPIAVTV